MTKSNILITLAFDCDKRTDYACIDAEMDIQEDIKKLLQKYSEADRIEYFAIADEEMICDKLLNAVNKEEEDK